MNWTSKTPYRRLIMLGARMLFVLVLPALVFCPPNGTANLTTGLSEEKASFSIKFQDEINPFHVTAVFVLPGELLNIGVVSPKTHHQYALESRVKDFCFDGEATWQWHAPEKTGLYPVKINDVTSNESMLLNVFVMVPLNALKDGVLNGYRIGQYPAKPLKNLPLYRPPLGFVEVTPENKNTLVSPHFKLSQFLCKQEGQYPKYIVLRERLIYDLEHILTRVNESGYACQTLAVMSGYRTPYYNQAIRNVRYSRHQWGDAADIYIDNNNDGVMDDLNGDGKVDYKDSVLLSRLIEGMESKSAYDRFIGGIGTYKPTRNHGPFVHVDTRGQRVEW